MARTAESLGMERRLLLGVGLVGMVGLFLLYLNPPSFYRLPGCPLYSLTGLLCPGCGTTRCLHSLLHADLGQAFRYNPLTVLLIPYVVVSLAYQVGWSLGWMRQKRTLISPRIGWMLFATVIAFFVLRNLPFAMFDILRPV